MTIQEATSYLRSHLRQVYEESEATAISDLAMEHLTGIKKTDRISSGNRDLSIEESTLFDAYLERMLKHEPIQYILNEAWFCGLRYYVDKHVLIPRPETEELVDWIITDCKFPINDLSILDIGTGSGCIAIALKRRLGKAGIWACDISEPAIAIAKKNAANLGADIHLLMVDFLDPARWDQFPVFDVIVSNPPYIPEKDKPGMHSNVVDYEPATALFVPDSDPLLFYHRIAEFGREKLAATGMIYMEIHEEMGAEASSLFEAAGYQAIIRQDMQGKNRMLKVVKK